MILETPLYGAQRRNISPSEWIVGKPEVTQFLITVVKRLPEKWIGPPVVAGHLSGNHSTSTGAACQPKGTSAPPWTSRPITVSFETRQDPTILDSGRGRRDGGEFYQIDGRHFC